MAGRVCRKDRDVIGDLADLEEQAASLSARPSWVMFNLDQASVGPSLDLALYSREDAAGHGFAPWPI